MILEIAVEPAVVDIILGVEAEVKNARWTVCETVVISDLKVKKSGINIIRYDNVC